MSAVSGFLSGVKGNRKAAVIAELLRKNRDIGVVYFGKI